MVKLCYVDSQRAKETRHSIIIARLFCFAYLNRVRIGRETSTGKQKDTRCPLGRHVNAITRGSRHDLNDVRCVNDACG